MLTLSCSRALPAVHRLVRHTDGAHGPALGRCRQPQRRGAAMRQSAGGAGGGRTEGARGRAPLASRVGAGTRAQDRRRNHRGHAGDRCGAAQGCVVRAQAARAPLPTFVAGAQAAAPRSLRGFCVSRAACAGCERHEGAGRGPPVASAVAAATIRASGPRRGRLARARAHRRSGTFPICPCAWRQKSFLRCGCVSYSIHECVGSVCAKLESKISSKVTRKGTN